MLSIRLCRFCDGVTDTVVPGQTCTSPPLDSSTAVSGPAVIEEPDSASFPASASGPAARTAVTTVAVLSSDWEPQAPQTENC
jgi:hypothetical protein